MKSTRKSNHFICCLLFVVCWSCLLVVFVGRVCWSCFCLVLLSRVSNVFDAANMIMSILCLYYDYYLYYDVLHLFLDGSCFN